MKLSEKTKNFPWGIVCGICAIVGFYTMVGVVAAYLILNSIAAQTSDTVAFLSEWWQTLMFIVSIATTATAAASLVLYIIREVDVKKAKKAKEENSGESN